MTCPAVEPVPALLMLAAAAISGALAFVFWHRCNDLREEVAVFAGVVHAQRDRAEGAERLWNEASAALGEARREADELREVLALAVLTAAARRRLATVGRRKDEGVAS